MNRIFDGVAIPGHCQPFLYKGCKGNENRFNTRPECMAKCVGATSAQEQKGSMGAGVVEVCSLTTDAKISDEAKKCSTNKECDSKWACTRGYCCPSKDYICHLPANQGTQLNGQVSKAQKFVWLKGINNCLPFSYFGVDGNFNNFATYDSCIAACKP
ncbi:hypothetical protein PRIPAC_76191 [Pristionchus pacificus]|uniref:Uncharacterized protein n=1 Tax=Pristionchus pacificus TaxID=54126 RepID=A0A2A6C0A7_PRIPA|nr:hypothetical protein PRIPAC_76191 [Pristionchus pacificus]|eukprot:PDM71614.1 hypothetical protein PRIPAC_38021 [Pristionchus pacificus]